jgi:hypothetical protein
MEPNSSLARIGNPGLHRGHEPSKSAVAEEHDMNTDKAYARVPRGLILACLCAALLGLAFTGPGPLAELFGGSSYEARGCWRGDPDMFDVP